MARIIYGIQSDGLGHYSRSKLIIDHLLSVGHSVKILTAGRPYILMNKLYDVEKIQALNTVYKNNGVNYAKTVQEFLSNSTKRINEAKVKIKKIFKKFEADLVISDMEMFSSKIGISNKIPIIYIDNIHCFCYTDASKDLTSLGHQILKQIAKFVNIQTPNSKYVKKYFITSFFDANPKPRKKAEMIPSLIRDEIIQAKKTKTKNHIFVYQTTNTNKKLPKILKSISDEIFIIYGFNKNLKDKNLEFKKTSIDNSFMKDLASAKAIITNGGFSLMSEGIFLKKPILSNPLRGQVEQILNAVQLEKLGYGKYAKRLSPDLIKSFLYDLKSYKKNLKSYTQKNNRESFEKIDKEIELALKYPTAQRIKKSKPKPEKKKSKSSASRNSSRAKSSSLNRRAKRLS